MKRGGHFMTCIHKIKLVFYFIHKIKLVFYFTYVMHDGSHKYLRIMHTEVL